jgi:NAD(P)-dependent dehydrogenase (short-subunit alcohol dehydrogenase family)
MELKSWGIRVVTVNPSFHRTPLLAGGPSTVQRCWLGTDVATRAEYGEGYAEALTEAASVMLNRNSWDSANVTRSLRGAVSVVSPRSQYLVGLDARCVHPLIRQLPSWLAEGINLRFSMGSLPQPAALRSMRAPS